jgi:hypothetical protein
MTRDGKKTKYDKRCANKIKWTAIYCLSKRYQGWEETFSLYRLICSIIAAVGSAILKFLTRCEFLVHGGSRNKNFAYLKNGDLSFLFFGSGKILQNGLRYRTWGRDTAL